MKLAFKLFLLTGFLISCKQNQALSEITFYFKDGDQVHGYTPKKDHHKRGQYLEWRKKEKSIWFHEMDRDYLKAFKIDQDSISIVPSNSKYELFAINKETGLIDLYLKPHIADSCVTSDFITAMDFMFNTISFFTGDDDCPDAFEDDNCDRIVYYKTEDYILVNNKLKESIKLNRHNFSVQKLNGFL